MKLSYLSTPSNEQILFCPGYRPDFFKTGNLLSVLPFFNLAYCFIKFILGIFISVRGFEFKEPMPIARANIQIASAMRVGTFHDWIKACGGKIDLNKSSDGEFVSDGEPMIINGKKSRLRMWNNDSGPSSDKTWDNGTRADLSRNAPAKQLLHVKVEPSLS